MKQIAFILFTIAFFSCKPDKENNPEPTDSYFTSRRNNENWKGKTSIQTYNDSLFVFHTANEPNTEVLLLKIKYDGLKTYTLQNGQALYYTTVGGDVLTSQYVLAPAETGTLTITKYDAGQKVLEGSFNLELIKQRSNPENNIDKLQFTNGAFKGKLLN